LGIRELAMAKKILGWIVLAMVILYVVQNPAAAAATTKSIGSGLANIAAGIGDFFTSLTSG